MAYDYKKSRQNIIQELTQKTAITSVKSPKVSDLTFGNGKRAWISACFADIRKSTELFKDNTEKGDDKVARIMRAFSGEIIKIMRDENYIHIGLQGDCVYGVFSTPKKSNIDDIFSMSAKINTFIKMFNLTLEQNGFNTIKVGIGLSAGEDLIIKAGADYTGINDVLFIGNAVAEARHFASYANGEISNPIVAGSIFHLNLNEHNKKLLSKENKVYEGSVYSGNAVNVAMDKWITNEYKDN